MSTYTKKEIEIFAESTQRVHEGFKNMRDKKTPPRPSEFVGFSNTRTLPNLDKEVKKFLDKNNDQ